MAAEIRELVVRDLGKTCRPAAVLAVPDLPRTRSGKIMRRVARAAYLRAEPGDLSAPREPGGRGGDRGCRSAASTPRVIRRRRRPNGWPIMRSRDRPRRRGLRLRAARPRRRPPSWRQIRTLVVDRPYPAAALPVAHRAAWASADLRYERPISAAPATGSRPRTSRRRPGRCGHAGLAFELRPTAIRAGRLLRGADGTVAVASGGRAQRGDAATRCGARNGPRDGRDRRC